MDCGINNIPFRTSTRERLSVSNNAPGDSGLFSKRASPCWPIAWWLPQAFLHLHGARRSLTTFLLRWRLTPPSIAISKDSLEEKCWLSEAGRARWDTRLLCLKAAAAARAVGA